VLELFFGSEYTELILAAIFCALVIAAILAARVEKFLILLGASIESLFVFLHNAFYALGIITNHVAVLSRLMEALSVASFCIAVFLCPPAFLVGAVGSIVLTIKRQRRKAVG